MPPTLSAYSGSGELLKYFDNVKTGPGVWKARHYFDVYERHLSRFRNQADFTFMEVGIYSGGSLRMWRDYFGPRARIIGVDISTKTKVYENNPQYGSPDRILVGDQSSPTFWASALSEVGTIDAILDDGGHESYMQNATLEAVWPRLRPGGVYLTEDLSELNREYWRGVAERFVLGSGGMNRFHPVAKDCDWKHGYSIRRHPRKGCWQRPRNADQVETAAVTFHPGMLVLEKYAYNASAGLRVDMHGDQWQPPLKAKLNKHTGRVEETFRRRAR